MHSEQYEELCRRFIADQTGLPLDEVKSVSIPNPRRPGLPEYKHQIDLYWDTGNAIAQYLNIANVKWRGTTKVEQGAVLLLQQVRQQVAAHKAVMITNVGFTAGAIAAAKDHGIALHVVTPMFDASTLPRGDRASIRRTLHERALEAKEPLYSVYVEYRGLGLGREGATTEQAPPRPRVPNSAAYETRDAQPLPQSVSRPSVGQTGPERASENRGLGLGLGRHGDGGLLKK